LRVSIFMSVFNVHVNRIPINGKVEDLQYHAGKYFSAYVEKASLDNEQMGIVVSTPRAKVMFVQIAGLIARRIICRLKKDEDVKQGQRFGLIRFGSRVDVYLPLNTRLFVKKGDKVNAGKTLIGELA
jgi:phosphatidylserine decarboxylase